MRWNKKRFLLLGVALPAFMLALLDHIAVVSGTYPDFGAVPGSWGHLQFYRPLGMKGIVLEDWRDLTSLSPLSGEPFNTDRQSWISLDTKASLWQQTHPPLTVVADTTSASLTVNYKQGDGEFKDFNIWYHNSLGKTTRYGWTSKLRSHPRLLGVTSYDEQRHRIQVNTSGERFSLTVEGGYDHQVNPLYWLEIDTTTYAWDYDDSPQILSHRWDGNLLWHNLDSSKVGTEIFAFFRAGLWTWPGGERQSLSSMAYVSHRFSIGELSPFEIKGGVLSKQLGGNKNSRQFAEFFFPEISWKHFSATFGIKSLGKGPLFPDIDIQFKQGPLELSYETLQIINERVWTPIYNTSSVHHISSILKVAQLELFVGTWFGGGSSKDVNGYHGKAQFQFPWRMHASFGAATVNQSTDWIFANKMLTWQLDQDITLFSGALHSHLKLWGNHYLETQPGILQSETGLAGNSIFPGEAVLHLLNYTISAEVSDVIIGFTDSNILQDDVWSQYGDFPWNPNFSIMVNQLPETRFRYFSIIWVFDN